MKKLSIAVFVILIPLLFLAARYKDPYLSGVMAKSAEKSLKAGDKQAAVRLYERALKYKPRDRKNLVSLGQLYLELDQPEQALALYQLGMDFYPEDIEFVKGVCSSYIKSDQFSKAVEMLNGITSNYIRIRLGSIRPHFPELSPKPGQYDSKISVSVEQIPGVHYYYALDGSYPGLNSPEYKEPIPLQRGETELSIIAVSESGMVSDLVTAKYSLVNLKEPAVFADPVMEQIARIALKKPQGALMTNELEHVASLTNRGLNTEKAPQQIGTLADLTYFPALEELVLENTALPEDLSALFGLGTLKSLTISGCKLDARRIDGLYRLYQLQKLDISENQIESLSGLFLPESIETLDVSQNMLSDTGGLAHLSGLSSLYIADNRLSDLTGIPFGNLKFLDISRNRLDSIDAVKNAQGIETLICAGNHISDISALSQNKSLKTLDLRGNDISQITALQELNALEFLNIGTNKISDIRPLKGKNCLIELVLKQNYIKDVSPLNGLKNLIMLDITDNLVTDVSSLQDCGKLMMVFADQDVKGGKVAAAGIVSGVEVQP